MAIFAAIEAAAPARRLSRSQRTQQTGCKNYNDMLWARSDKALCSRVALQQKGCCLLWCQLGFRHKSAWLILM